MKIVLLKLSSLLFVIQTSKITTKLNAWKTDIETVLNLVTGVFAIAGGFLIFFQYMQGNDQAQKNFIRFIIGLGIVGLVNFIAGVFI